MPKDKEYKQAYWATEFFITQMKAVCEKKKSSGGHRERNTSDGIIIVLDSILEQMKQDLKDAAGNTKDTANKEPTDGG